MKDIILKFNKNVLKRYEHNLNNGTVFLFNVETEEIWTGNGAADCLLRLIDGKQTLEEIYAYLFPLFDGFDKNELKESFDNIVKSLLSKGFLEGEYIVEQHK